MEFGAPRVCGDDPCYLPWAAGASHVLPAYAGMIPNEGYGVNHDRGAPRVCGDDPAHSQRTNASDAVLPAYAGMIPSAPC